jgi:hypothetical protein
MGHDAATVLDAGHDAATVLDGRLDIANDVVLEGGAETGSDSGPANTCTTAADCTGLAPGRRSPTAPAVSGAACAPWPDSRGGARASA